MNRNVRDCVIDMVETSRREKAAEAVYYAKGICKAAEAAGVDPALVVQRMPVKTAMEKRARGLLKALGKMGLWGLAGYGGYHGYHDVENLRAPPPEPPPAPEPSTWDNIKGFAAEHPVGTAAAVIGIPLAAYLGYKLLKGKDEDRAPYPYR